MVSLEKNWDFLGVVLEIGDDLTRLDWRVGVNFEGERARLGGAEDGARMFARD